MVDETHKKSYTVDLHLEIRMHLKSIIINAYI